MRPGRVGTRHRASSEAVSSLGPPVAEDLRLRLGDRIREAATHLAETPLAGNRMPTRAGVVGLASRVAA
jgi:hypothetical protein